MSERKWRKCTSRHKNQKRWGVEFPLEWVIDLEMKEAMLDMEKTDDAIIIKKIHVHQSEKPTQSEDKEKPYDYGDSVF